MNTQYVMKCCTLLNIGHDKNEKAIEQNQYYLITENTMHFCSWVLETGSRFLTWMASTAEHSLLSRSTIMSHNKAPWWRHQHPPSG